MTQRTPEEIQAQREAWLARKAGGQAQPVAPQPPPMEPDQIVASASTAPASAPQAPAAKRSAEEAKAQREAFLAAKAAGTTAPKPVEAAPAPVAKPVPALQPAVPQEPAKTGPVVSRREFLNYTWLASMALVTAQGIGASLWFSFPNFKEGEFGGAFPIGEATGVLPEVNAAPKAYTDGKFWLVNVDTEVNGQPRQGVMAIFKVCTHLGCLYEWVDMTNRFECPCHGSKFELPGDYISGPARRSLDRFVVQAISPDGSIKETDAEGNPLVINGDEILVIDTSRRIYGAPVLVPA